MLNDPVNSQRLHDCQRCPDCQVSIRAKRFLKLLTGQAVLLCYNRHASGARYDAERTYDFASISGAEGFVQKGSNRLAGRKVFGIKVGVRLVCHGWASCDLTPVVEP